MRGLGRLFIPSLLLGMRHATDGEAIVEARYCLVLKFARLTVRY